MERNTPLAEDIRVTSQAAEYDAACKRLLSEKPILAWILKSCLKEYRDCTVNEIAEKYIEGQPQVSETPVEQDETAAPKIRGIRTEDTSLREGTSTYDIRFLAIAPSSGEVIQLIIDVEAQKAYDPGYPLLKRAIYYCGRMLTAQNGTEFVHSEYQKIKKVVSIWICMKPPAKRRNTITRYHLTEENLVGNVKEQVWKYDLIDVVMLCLGGKSKENYDGVLMLLDKLLSSKVSEAEKRQVLEREFGIPMTETLDREVLDMCNLSQGVRELGREEERLASIRNLMTNMNWSAEQAMNALSIPEEDRQKYARLLRE